MGATAHKIEQMEVNLTQEEDQIKDQIHGQY
jgi:hypothetical protein